MDISREQFVDHFAIALDLQCFKRWPKGVRKRAPTWLSSCFYQWMRTSAEDIEATAQRFNELIDPLIEELHQVTPRGQSLDRQVVTGMIYDRLAAGGIKVRIRPPLTAHSVRNGPG